MKEKEYGNGNKVSLRKRREMYVVTLWIGSEVYDRVRCETYSQASDYFRSFCKIAKNWKGKFKEGKLA